MDYYLLAVHLQSCSKLLDRLNLPIRIRIHPPLEFLLMGSAKRSFTLDGSAAAVREIKRARNGGRSASTGCMLNGLYSKYLKGSKTFKIPGIPGCLKLRLFSCCVLFWKCWCGHNHLSLSGFGVFRKAHRPFIEKASYYSIQKTKGKQQKN